MNLAYRVAACAAILSAASLAFSAPSPKKALTIEDAVKLALENNADLQQGKITLDQAKRESRHSANSFLPSIGAEGIVTKTGDLNDKDSQESFRFDT